MRFERLAPAKLNLFLHVGPVSADGYHPICSLVTFADIGDIVGLRRAAEMGFEIEGPFAEGLDTRADNLVTRARDLMLGAYSPAGDNSNFILTLDKRLPIASGLGGGSADAAATMRLLAETLSLGSPDVDTDAFARIALSLGSDVPMCLAGTPMIAEGRGEELTYPPVFPDLEVVLVNPGVASPTGPVYRAFDDAGAPGEASLDAWPDSLETVRDLTAFLATTRNDLEAPAIALAPAIGETLAVLRKQPETLFARMSGSGATCFAICADRAGRNALAERLAAFYPGWWVRPCRLAGFRA